MKTHLIISVGTSMIGNYKRETKIDTLPDFTFAQPGLIGNFDLCSFPQPLMFCEDYPDMVPVLSLEQAKGAEHSAIEKVLEKKKLDYSDCVFHLIATDTPQCMFCASFLGHNILTKGQTCFHIPEGLVSADNKMFSSRGLPNLLACLAGILEKIEHNGDEAVIVPIGGYKIIVPYLTIASILYKCPAYYIYEGSKSLIELPAPPLGINTSEFRSIIVLLENIIGLNGKEAFPYFMALPKTFRHLVFINKSNVYEYNAFGKRLKQMFIYQSAASPLTLRASDNSLMPHLGKYKDIFSSMAGLGGTVWLGDKAPEMADHAQHHHTNLFAYTELLLLPLLSNKSDFLSQEELFLLLGMVYLHDCGHSLNVLPGHKPMPLLPTEIRNFHNILGFFRLNDPEFHKTLKRQGMEIDIELLKNIGMVSVYHRKKMPLIQGSCTGPEGTLFKALKHCEISINSSIVNGDRLALLVSLFRIIDGMDKQVDRTGDAVEISMKAESILADLGPLHNRAFRIQEALNSVSSQAREIADILLNEIVEDYGLKEAPASQSKTKKEKICTCTNRVCSPFLQSPPDFTEQTYYSKLSEMLLQKNLGSYIYLAWEYLEAKTRFFFQALQPSYYYSDLILGMPRVVHSDSNGFQCITINYPKNKDMSRVQEKIKYIWNEIQTWIKINVKPDSPEYCVVNASLAFPKQIIQGIRNEYCSKKYNEVAKILNDAGIRIEFQYQGEPVTCWK